MRALLGNPLKDIDVDGGAPDNQPLCNYLFERIKAMQTTLSFAFPQWKDSFLYLSKPIELEPQLLAKMKECHGEHYRYGLELLELEHHLENNQALMACAVTRQKLKGSVDPPALHRGWKIEDRNVKRPVSYVKPSRQRSF